MIVTLAAMIVGTALWGYGLSSQAPPQSSTGPNMELELGLVLVCLGSLAPS